MHRHIIRLECRHADTKVAGIRTQATEEAKRAAVMLERSLSTRAPGCVVGDPNISILRWKDSGELCNVDVGADVDVNRLSVESAEDTLLAVMRELRDGRFRRG